MCNSLLKESKEHILKIQQVIPNIFDPIKFIDPTDKDFGLQKNLRMLLYAGIEKKSVANYVAAMTYNPKEEDLTFGEIKTAVANFEGTNNSCIRSCIRNNN